MWQIVRSMLGGSEAASGRPSRSPRQRPAAARRTRSPRESDGRAPRDRRAPHRSSPRPDRAAVAPHPRCTKAPRVPARRCPRYRGAPSKSTDSRWRSRSRTDSLDEPAARRTVSPTRTGAQRGSIPPTSGISSVTRALPATDATGAMGQRGRSVAAAPTASPTARLAMPIRRDIARSRPRASASVTCSVPPISPKLKTPAEPKPAQNRSRAWR